LVGTSQEVYCLFNFWGTAAFMSWDALYDAGMLTGAELSDLWSGKTYIAGSNDEFLVLQPYEFMILK